MDKNIIVAVINGKPMVDTVDVWKSFGYASHKNLIDVIKGKKERFERNGVLAHSAPKPQKSTAGGRPTKGYLLSERQFITLVQYVHNTDETMDFKDHITNEFFRMREELAKVVTAPTASLIRMYFISLDLKHGGNSKELSQETKNKISKANSNPSQQTRKKNESVPCASTSNVRRNP